MITYYGYTISPNQLETGEGFLICRNVPIARTGTQEYLAEEVGKDGGGIVKVLRPEAEVFSPAALASFEGKPFTNDHPPVMLTPENVSGYEVGHVQNVRRGSGEWADFVVADIHIHDAATISAVENGKRQISAGYEVEYKDNGDGTLTQTNIRGNHVALVDEARAGDRAAIMDSNKTKEAEQPPERKRKHMSKRNSFWNLFGAAASGKTAEEITELGAVMDEALADAESKPEGEKPAEPEGEPAVKDGDSDYQKKLFESIDALNQKFDAWLAAQAPKQEPEEKDPIDEALEVIENELGVDCKDEDPEAKPAEEAAADCTDEEKPAEDETAAEGGEEAHVVPAEEMDAEKDCGPAMDAATRKNILLAMRPAIANIKDEAQRKAMTDAVLKIVNAKKETAQDSDAAKLAKIAAGVKAPKAKNAIDIDAVQALYDARNPHKAKKEDK